MKCSLINRSLVVCMTRVVVIEMRSTVRLTTHIDYTLHFAWTCEVSKAGKDGGSTSSLQYNYYEFRLDGSLRFPLQVLEQNVSHYLYNFLRFCISSLNHLIDNQTV